MKSKKIIAEKHGDICTIPGCKYWNDNRCWFGLRARGCPYINPELSRKLGIHARVETDLTISMYEHDPYNAERRDQVDIPIIESLMESAVDKAAMITGKTYSFVFNGHEYSHRDNSMDFGSCPHCGHQDGHEHIGYYSSGEKRISCFECEKCSKKFYYHDSAMKVMEGMKSVS